MILSGFKVTRNAVRYMFYECSEVPVIICITKVQIFLITSHVSLKHTCMHSSVSCRMKRATSKLCWMWSIRFGPRFVRCVSVFVLDCAL